MADITAIPERRYKAIPVYISKDNEDVWDEAREVAREVYPVTRRGALEGNMAALATDAMREYLSRHRRKQEKR